MTEQLYTTPALIFDEANGLYEPRLARMFKEEGWKCLGFDHHRVIVTKRDIILLICAGCRNDWDQHGRGQCEHHFPKCIWDNMKHGEEASGILEDICLHGMIGPDGVHYDLHMDGGLFFIPPGWTWVDGIRGRPEGYRPNHCEDCHHLEKCDAYDHDYMLSCKVHETEEEEEEEEDDVVPCLENNSQPCLGLVCGKHSA